MSEWLACWHAMESNLHFSVSSVWDCLIGKNENQFQYRHGRSNTHIHTHSSSISCGKQNAYHMKTFYFCSEAWDSWQIVPLTSVPVFLLLIHLCCCLIVASAPPVHMSLERLVAELANLPLLRIAWYPVVHIVLGNAAVESLFVESPSGY